MKNVLILGKDGMAGHVLYRFFNSLDKYNVFSTSRKEANIKKNIFFYDALQFNSISSIIRMANPDVVINCIGILPETSKKKSRYCNFNKFLFASISP